VSDRISQNLRFIHLCLTFVSTSNFSSKWDVGPHKVHTFTRQTKERPTSEGASFGGLLETKDAIRKHKIGLSSLKSDFNTRQAMVCKIMDDISDAHLMSPESHPAEVASTLMCNGKDEEALDTGKSLENFISFSRLPTEIRIRIWKYACPEARIIKMKNRCEIPWVAIPIIAHINQESRSEALRIYRLGFRPTRGTCKKLWWNPSADTIFVDDFKKVLAVCEAMLGPSISEVRHLALPTNMNIYEMLSSFHAKLLHKFTAVETLDLVINRRYALLKDDLFFVRPPQVIGVPKSGRKSATAQVEEFKSAVDKAGRMPTIRIVTPIIKRRRVSVAWEKDWNGTDELN
jgi:hypothetical protein